MSKEIKIISYINGLSTTSHKSLAKGITFSVADTETKIHITCVLPKENYDKFRKYEKPTQTWNELPETI